MKRNFTRILTLCALLSSGTMFAQLTPEVLYYKFDGSGNTVPNLASAPPVGTTTANIQGGITQGGNSLCGGSLIGSGITSTTDFLNTGWTPNLGNTSWTIAWRSQGISTSATLFYIFGDLGTSSFRCFTNGVAGSTNWILRGAGLTDSYINGGALSTSTFCAYVYDATLNQVRGYLNGVLVSTTNQTAPNLTGTGPLKVMGYSANIGAPAGGLMDEFRLYSRALTAQEIMQLNNPFIPSGFLGSDINLCTSGSVPLSLGWPANTIAWSTGATTDTTSVSTTSLVTVSVSGACGTGMDSLMVTILSPTASTLAVATCDMDYITPSGDTLALSGMYMDTIPNMAGCDSVITINYMRNVATTATMSVTNCGSYTAPSGQMITSSGMYMDTIANMAGCDSVITINATINQASSATWTGTMCDMYTAPSGAMYTSSGMYMDTIANMAGCDSVITINLTITNSSTASVTASACDMYMAPSGAMYTSSGMYMDTIANMAGCDSVITINLTINGSTTGTLAASACDMYTAPSGAVLTSTGTYMDTISNMAGCDSVITINLMIMNSSSSTMNAASCGNYTAPSGAVYTTSGTYMDTIANMAGCDSVITIALTVTTVNAGATASGQVCTATGTTAGATFQWIDCNGMTAIAGATQINYTATANGSYAVIITIGNCSDTSSCVSVTGIGIEENAFASGITLYPNPNSGNFNINLGNVYNDVTVVITDLTGRVVYSHIENSATMIPVQLDAAAGAYVVIVTSGENKATFRITKD